MRRTKSARLQARAQPSPRGREDEGIADWPASERPRERLLRQGPESLADAELLAICLRTGARGKSAVDLAREIIVRSGSVRALLAAGADDMAGMKGLGKAKRAQILAVMELARRALREELETRGALSTPGAVRDYLRLALARADREVFLALLLDAQHRIVSPQKNCSTAHSLRPASTPERSSSARCATMRPPSSLRTTIPRGLRNPAMRTNC